MGDWGSDGKAVHLTRYLHKDGIFQTRFAKLRERIVNLALMADHNEGWGLLGNGDGQLAAGVTVRCAEYHEMLPGGTLPEFNHYDIGSLVTIDIMLEEPS